MIVILPLRLIPSTVCVLTVLQNLPVLLMYVCLIVFHRFLLRIYKVMTERDQPKKLFYVEVYYWSMLAMLIISQAISTTAICVNYEVTLRYDWNKFFEIKSIIIISIVLLCHTVISIIVLPVFYKQINYSSIIAFAIFLSLLFEVIMIYREYIDTMQSKIKVEDPKRWNRVMISYFATCEMTLYVGLIGEIFHQAFLMRKRTKKYTGPASPRLEINHTLMHED